MLANRFANGVIVLLECDTERMDTRSSRTGKSIIILHAAYDLVRSTRVDFPSMVRGVDHDRGR